MILDTYYLFKKIDTVIGNLEFLADEARNRHNIELLKKYEQDVLFWYRVKNELQRLLNL